ncbi:MAG TPA: methylmalonyl Co-A mutase-associated GTPase MeaB, partial [Gemmatimonadaceae bacterium]|nr:methylmalonyl Co-A mutase-associated GTPase MeaB [Gemmatimonadaceae bacterium]
AGKSTLTDKLIGRIRKEDVEVGVLAIDPSSPFSGGAILGDRVRMQDHATDPGVFIRSMATRGHLGGLSLATPQAVRVLDAAGKPWVLIETVGVGQVEIEVAGAADTTMVVVNPGWGDAVQAAKAGLLEIADVFVVNKADRPGADRLRNEIEIMLGMRGGSTMRNVPAHHGVDLSRNNLVRQVREAARSDDAELWTPPVLRTVAAKEEGIDEVVEALDRHFRYLERSGTLRERRRARLRERVVEVVEDKARRRLWGDAATNAWLEERLPALEAGEATPFGIADALLNRSADLLTRTTK